MLRLEARKKLREIELDLALDVAAGSCLALAGPSGAGKSTALRIVAGLERADAGVVSLNGERWLDTAAGIDVPAEQRGCGFLFQSYALFPNLAAWENVAYGLKEPRRARRSAAEDLLERFGLRGVTEARPRELSGGERQRVALARALACRPRVLLLDEPLSALDARTRADAGRTLSEALAATRVPSLLVTHDFEEAAVFAGEVAIIDRGHVVQQGTASELADSPGNAFVADFTGAVVLSGTVVGREEGLTLVRLDQGPVIRSTEEGVGAVAVSFHPWELTIEPAGSVAAGSALNHLETVVESVTEIGNRARVGLNAGQHLTAEVTRASARRLALAPGAVASVTWKATATRLVASVPSPAIEEE